MHLAQDVRKESILVAELEKIKDTRRRALTLSTR